MHQRADARRLDPHYLSDLPISQPRGAQQHTLPLLFRKFLDSSAQPARPLFVERAMLRAAARVRGVLAALFPGDGSLPAGAPSLVAKIVPRHLKDPARNIRATAVPSQ